MVAKAKTEAKGKPAKVRPLKGGRLEPYRQKRDFEVTPEPTESTPTPKGNAFVVHKHAATRLHYDLRIEIDGVYQSWAVTKAPTFDPAVKRLAVHVEDHPISYGDFEGTIPENQYGAGTVIIWDRGSWAPMGDAEALLKKGELKFRLFGQKLKGGFALIRLRDKTPRDGGRNWLLIKEKDEYAQPGSGDSLAEQDRSVVSGLTIEEMASARAATAPARKKVKKVRPADLPGARATDLGDVPEPQLATLAAHPPAGDGWIHEIKYDGYRTLARLEDGAVQMITRNGYDWTEKYRPIADAIAALPVKNALLDGEICVQLPNGSTSFSALQDALATNASGKLVYFLFDLLHLDGYDLRRVPLIDRKRALESLLAPHAAEDGALHYCEHFQGEGTEFLAQALRMQLEGIVSKRADAIYESGRSRSWIKVKGSLSNEFRIVGFTESKAAGGLSSLLMAERSGSGFTYVGKVGTGFTGATAKELTAKLKPLLRDSPISNLVMDEKVPGARWVEPKLTAEIEYANKTDAGHLRAGRFKGLRGKAEAAPVSEGPSTRPPQLVTDSHLAQIFITNPDRRMFSDDGPSKLDVAMYYAQVGDWMLPQIAGRPLTLVRSPSGKIKDQFYQRHAMAGMPADIQRIALPKEDDPKEREDYLYITDAKGLLALAQFGVVEFHTWGCKVDEPERPDRMVFDLDPDEGLDWARVVEAGFEVREYLVERGFTPFARTTGGKGLHVVIDVQRTVPWNEFKEFSHAAVLDLANRSPQRYTANMSKKERRGRIFIDYLRNGRSATAAASYSLRARVGCPAATPLTWDELRELESPKVYDWKTVPQRLRSLQHDPWAGIEAAAGRITPPNAKGR